MPSAQPNSADSVCGIAIVEVETKKSRHRLDYRLGCAWSPRNDRDFRDSVAEIAGAAALVASGCAASRLTDGGPCSTLAR